MKTSYYRHATSSAYHQISPTGKSSHHSGSRPLPFSSSAYTRPKSRPRYEFFLLFLLVCTHDQLFIRVASQKFVNFIAGSNLKAKQPRVEYTVPLLTQRSRVKRREGHVTCSSCDYVNPPTLRMWATH